MAFPCPHCRRCIPFPPHLAGKSGECTWCGKKVRYPRNDLEGRHPAEVQKRRRRTSSVAGRMTSIHRREAEPTEISKSIACPFCQRQILTRSLWEEQYERCPYCHELFDAADIGLVLRVDSEVQSDPDGLREMDEEVDPEEVREIAVICEWMIDQLQERKQLYQRQVVDFIRSQYGDKYLYTNENGNPAIEKIVLREFRQQAKGRSAWDKHGSYWRWDV